MIKYEIKQGLDGKEYIEMTKPDGTISLVPTDPANSDYQRYLNPEAEQSTPSVIDEA
jgi:hypothetical protein